MNTALFKSLRNSVIDPFKYIRRSLYSFSKKKSSSPLNTNYNQKNQQLQKPIPKTEPQEPVPPTAQPLEDQKLIEDTYLRKLIMANTIMAGTIPFWGPINAGIVVLNGGFILSQVARQIKQYLTLVNNEHYQQLGKFQKPQQYLRIISNNLLFMSINCIFLSFGYYTSAHLGTLAWYLFNVISEFLPFHYWIMIFPIIVIILWNQLGSAALKEVFPSEMEIISSIQPQK